MRGAMRQLGTALLLIVLGACSTPVPISRAAAPTPSATAPTCQLRGALPDPVCAPGVADPAVTQENIDATICIRGYTRTVRPPVAYTDSLKQRQLLAYGLTEPIADYEEDHLIPLEVGGSPADPRNLWPEPRDVILPGEGAETKDKLENRLHDLVCSGALLLSDAQHAVATDWLSAYRLYVSS
jgi:hypothetical protein